MSRNDIFSTSFRIQPPPSPLLASTSPIISHHHSTSLPDDSFNNNSSLARARTTGQSYLRSRAPQDRPLPPLDPQGKGLQRNRSVHIADKPYVYLLSEMQDTSRGYEDDYTPLAERDEGRISMDTLSPSPRTPLISLPARQSSEPGPSRTSSFFDLPSSRIDPPSALPSGLTRPLTSSSSDFSSAYSTRSNPSLMEELPWEVKTSADRDGASRVGERDAELEDVQLRLREERGYFLGEGRFAKVWVAAFQKPSHRRSFPKLGEEDDDPEAEHEPTPIGRTYSANTGRNSGKGSWRLCAAKQPLPDAESQLLGRREAFFLRHLRHPTLASVGDQVRFSQGRKYVVRLLGIVRRDGESGEREGRTVHSVPPPLPLRLPPPDEERFTGLSLHESASYQLPQGPNLSLASATTPLASQPYPADPFRLAPPPTPPFLRHARSVSDTHSPFQVQAQAQSSLLSPTPHAPKSRSRGTSPIRNWLGALPPSPPSPATLAPPSVTVDARSPAQTQAEILLLLSFHPSGSLASLLHSHPHKLTPQLYTTLSWELAMALAYVHSCGVLHTDVKPQNVLLSYTTPPGRDSGLTLNAGAGPVQVEYSARLADFGSALLLPPFTASSPTDGLGLGTPGYTAPELLLPPGSCSFSYSADVFSLGVVLGVLLFGREPYARLVGRGRGRLEMMRWAKKGGYWAYEEGVRLASVGELGQPRGEDEAGEEERVPRLGRNDLLELLANDGTERQEEELEEREDVVWPSPPELKLDPSSSEDSLTPGAANVEERNIPELVLSRVPHHLSGNPMVPLGVKEPIPLPSPPNSPPKSAANATTAHAHTRTRTSLHTPTTHSSQGVLSPPPPLTSPATPSAPYADGSPPIFFLGPSTLTGQPERAPDALVSLVKRMCSPNSEGRPEMDEVVSVLGALREAYCLV